MPTEETYQATGSPMGTVASMCPHLSQDSRVKPPTPVLLEKDRPQKTSRACKIELRPTATQANYFARCAGTMRFVYNQLVARNKEGVKYNRKEYQKFCSTLRAGTPWMNEVTSRATYEAADDFYAAMQNFFKSCKGQRKGAKMRGPSFKKKGGKQSFRFSHASQFKVAGRKLRIGGMKSLIPMREVIRFEGPVRQVTIKLHGGKWFAFFLVDTETVPKATPNRLPCVGVDFGLTTFATLSTGEKVANPRHLKRSLKLLRRRQRQLSRAKPGSKRREIKKRRVARIHRTVSDRRAAFQHGFVNSLVTRFDRIVIEDLNINGMLKNHKLARAISDAGWATTASILEYKCCDHACELEKADRWFASSKTCCKCGVKKEKLGLHERTFLCDSCGAVEDRDVNAAMNLEKYIPSPPITGRRKTDTIDLRKSRSRAGSLDGVNINPNRGSLPNSLCEQLAVI